MTNAPTPLEKLWTLAATLLARFVDITIDARAFARMLCAPDVIVRDALNRVRAIEALAKRLLLAQALTLRVAPRAPARTTRVRDAHRKRSGETPLSDDPRAWRVQFHFGAIGTTTGRRAPTPPTMRAPRHPIFGKPKRLYTPRPSRPYDADAARRWRDARRARKEKAWHDYWFSPYQPRDTTNPGYVEIAPSNEGPPMASTLPVARRLEALRRVIADPLIYARRLAQRLTAHAAAIPDLVTRLRARRTRTPGCAEAMALIDRTPAGRGHDTS